MSSARCTRCPDGIRTPAFVHIVVGAKPKEGRYDGISWCRECARAALSDKEFRISRPPVKVEVA